jgi:hypothetical protein
MDLFGKEPVFFKDMPKENKGYKISKKITLKDDVMTMTARAVVTLMDGKTTIQLTSTTSREVKY